MKRRVVITGLGVVAPNGIGKEDFWQANVSGRSGVRRITRFDASLLGTQIAGEVVGFCPEDLGLTPDEILNLDRGSQFALASANLALQDAALPELDEDERDRIGVYLGSAMAASEEGEKLWIQITNRGRQAPDATLDIRVPSVHLLSALIPSNAIAAHYAFHGPGMVISTGCSAGGDAIGEAFWAIQDDRADRMLAGGTDSSICYPGLNVFCVMKAVSTRNDEPERASRPYDAQRDGFVLAEGAGVLLLEERSLALARGAHIYAEIISFTSTSNAHHMTALPEDGSPLQHLLKQALLEANITSTQLHYINSHGSSTPSNEPAETIAYKAVFGAQAYNIPISATKSMIGHTQGAASAIEAVVTALVLDQQIIPPTINQEHADPRCDLDYVPNVARPTAVEVALTHSSGFGGVNSALILAKANWSDSNV
jgi:3-oxoacyl-(acyl-carrier-protein) synthase